MRQRYRIAGGIAIAALCLSALAVALNRSPRSEQVAIAHLVSKTKTICVGRFFFDLPAEAQVEFGAVDVDGIKIAAFYETREEFEDRLAERQAQIAARLDRLGGNENLESSRDVKTGSGLVGRIFVHNRNVTEGTRANGLKLERYRFEDVTVEGLVHGDGISIALLSEGRDPKYVDDVPALVKQLVTNPRNLPIAESGFCFNNAYLRDPLTAAQGEQITAYASLPSHPDIEFTLILAAGLKPDEQGLLERSSAADSALSSRERMRVSTLRASPREIAGVPGEELIERFVEKNDTQVHSFWWEAKGSEESVFNPHFVFKMNTGSSAQGPVPASLSDGAALALWDRILSSIRLRSNPAAQSKPPPTRSKSAASQERNP